MIDRHWLGDLSLAVLLALPLAVLAAPDAVPRKPLAPVPGAKFVSVPRLSSGRVSVLG